MKILFTHSYFLRFDAKQYKAAMPYPPLGTLYCMSYLRENGYEVKLFDTMFCHSAQDIRSTIDEFKPDVFISYDDGFNYLTKMCLTNMRDACFEMMVYARSKDCKVIVSSSDATDHATDYLTHGADAVVIGEAEQTVLELCDAFKKELPVDSIPGIVFFNNNKKPVKTGARPVLKDLDSLPPPAWELIDIASYRNMWLQNHGYFSLNFVTTRGCPYKCNWCAKPIYGNRYNSHSPENIVLEIKKWQQQFGFTHIWFADDIFGLKPGWLKDFEFHIRKEKVKISYKIQSRADLLEEDNIKHLANSGCTMVWMGAESGSQKILDAMDKGIKVEQIYEATRLLKKHHINVSLFLQLGYLNETMEDIHLTIKMVEDLLPDDIGISVSYPLPGTQFYDKVKEQLKYKSNWADSDDLDMMFKNTYHKDFYKQLQRYIHKRYRKQMGFASAKQLFSSPSGQHLKNTMSLLKMIPAEKIEKQKLKRIEPDAAASL